MNRSLVFTPGCDWKIDRRILFVEYETVTGKPMSKRFDLSAGTEYIADGYKTLSFDEISKPDSKLQYSIQKVVYFEKECNSMAAFSRGCGQTRLFIPTKVYFDTKAKKTAEETYNKLILQNANSAYGIASRDWGDVLADSARYIHMQQSRCNGKTLWLSSATSFADKKPLCNIADYYHDICEQWLKTPPEPVQFISDDLEDCEKGVPNTKLIDPNGYFDTDMASSLQAKLMKSIENSKYGISFSDGDTVKKIKNFEEEIKMAEKTRFDMYKPTVKKVIFSEPATIVFWTDGTKTIVKCGENDIYDPEKGVAMCCMKKLLGTNKTGSNYLDNNATLRGVKRHIQKWEEDNRKEAKSMEESIEKEFEAVTSNDWTVVPADENTTAEEDGE